MSENKGGGTPGWVKGCGIGCLVILVLGIAGAVFIFFSVQKGMKKATAVMATQLKQEYDKLKTDGKVPADQTALFDEIVGIAGSPDASFWTVGVVAADVRDSLADGQVSEDEVKRATAVRDFFKANTNCGLAQFSQFVKEHPEFQETFQKMRQNPPTVQ